jgi:hypothetical protein
VIGHVADPGKDVAGLLYYLYGDGRRDEHVNPHLVAGWEDPATLEPPASQLGNDGWQQRDFRRLVGLLEQPVAAIRPFAPELYVWHCVLRAAPDDPDLGDRAWCEICARVMDHTGLSPRGREQRGVRWVALHHGDNHVHIVATLARQDARRASVNNLYWRIGEALTAIEKEYGLRALVRDRTADKAPTQAEMARAQRAGRSETARASLRRIVQAAAVAARTDAEFLAAVEARGGLARPYPRHSSIQPGEITGYSVGLPGDTTADGQGGRRQVWYGGSKLASDLTLPRLRKRWAGVPGSPAGGLTGQSMHAETGRIVLAREALRAARGAHGEAEFFARLEQAGLQVRHPHDPATPGSPSGWDVTLPGLADGAGQPAWYRGGTLDPRLRLGELRARWRAGRPGVGPGSDLFTGFDVGEIYQHATRVGQQAATMIGEAAPAGQAAIAWAASDLIGAAAEATGSPTLARAAAEFARAVRPAWGRLPIPTPFTAVIRTAAYLLASCVPGRYRGQARRALVDALTRLARTLAKLRAGQDHQLQRAAATRAAASLVAAAEMDLAADAPAPAAAAFPDRPQARRSARPSTRSMPRAAPTSSPTLRHLPGNGPG